MFYLIDTLQNLNAILSIFILHVYIRHVKKDVFFHSFIITIDITNLISDLYDYYIEDNFTLGLMQLIFHRAVVEI